MPGLVIQLAKGRLVEAMPLGATDIIAHNVRLQFQLVQPMLDDIANTYDAYEPLAFCHRHMPDVADWSSLSLLGRWCR